MQQAICQNVQSKDIWLIDASFKSDCWLSSHRWMNAMKIKDQRSITTIKEVSKSKGWSSTEINEVFDEQKSKAITGN